MRLLAYLLAVLGVIGIVWGIVIMVAGSHGPRAIPFQFETYGGPGPIIGGLMLVAAGVYLGGAWARKS